MKYFIKEIPIKKQLALRLFGKGKDMVENPGSKDKSFEALDFIINVLKEHELNLDKSIEEIGTVSEQINETIEDLKAKVEKAEEKVNILQKEVTNLTGCLSNTPEKALPITSNEQASHVQAALALSPAVQNNPPLILHCKQWTDFQLLAMNAQTLTFIYKEEGGIFEVNALKENQLIQYSGVLPNISSILKIWLSTTFDLDGQKIFEGLLEKIK